MIKALDNKPVFIPLSGGFDSRIIAYLLKKNRYFNVFCFTYGTTSSSEQNNAKKTAANLGYKWRFINYEQYFDYSWKQDPYFREYVDFSAGYSNKFYMQEYLALHDLRKSRQVPENAVFISGHSGAVAGHLLKKAMLNADFNYVDHALEDVFSFVYPRSKDIKLIRKEIDLLNNPGEKYPSYLIYENWRFQETTVKLGLNASKLWDFFDYEYLLPLWDKELFRFFAQVPLVHKYDKNLYMETLAEMFEEYNISFKKNELYPSEKLVKQVSFRSKVKKCLPFLKRLVNPWKNDMQGARFFTREFVDELMASHCYRKILSVNGIYSEWYLLQIRKKHAGQ
jgi:asparagine synthase (glutamine-hydrolysing)